MSALNNSLLLGQEGGGGYSISRSLRFNAADSSFLSRTPASAGNRKTWTWAGWVKRSAVGVDQSLFSAYTGTASDEAYTDFRFASDDTLRFGGWYTGWRNTTQIFRDASAWYHIVLSVDIGNPTENDRIRVYLNGAQITAFATANNPATTSQLAVNSASAHNIGANVYYTNTTNKFSGLLADIHFCDGTAYDASAFGEFDANGIWQPKKFAGVYGTNGFHLDFSNNASAAALGTDTSGNGNTWTVNNIQATVQTGRLYAQASGTSTSAFSSATLLGNFPATVGGSYAIYDADLVTPVTSATFSYLYSFSSVVEVLVSADGTNWTSKGNQSSSYTTVSHTSAFRYVRWFYSTFNFGITNNPAGNDSLVDVPSSTGTDTGVGGEVRGNYCTLNPLTSTSGTYSQGNLRFVGPSAYRRSNGSIAVSTGKWYWEVTLGNGPVTPRISTSQWNAFGFGLSTVFGSTTNMNAVTDALVLQDNGYYKNFSGSNTDGGTAFSSGDVLSIAVDLDANTFTFRQNNTQIVTGTIGGTAGRELVPVIISYDGQYGVMDCNFGQRPFAYTAPSGFKALCTANLPAPLVTKPSTVMDVLLWSGTGGNRSLTALNMSPDFVWIKQRNQAYSVGHQLYDIVRGAGSLKQLDSSNTTAEGGGNTNQYGYLSSFDSAGFSVTAGSVDSDYVNKSGVTYAAWCWDAGSSTVTNTQGSISSQVRANASAGFSIVTWTGNGSTTATVGHGLGVTPGLVIQKSRSGAWHWRVWHSSLGTSTTNMLILSLTEAVLPGDTNGYITSLNSSTFGFGGGVAAVNATSATHVAYCFAPVAGYANAFSYTGNGSSDGPFCFLGFRPKLLLLKRTDAAEHWIMYDAARNTYNVVDLRILANSSSAEASLSTNPIDILSNGFKHRGSDAFLNANGGTYIGFAWAESPFQYARAR